MNRTLVAFVDRAGQVDVFERTEDVYWNRVEYKRVPVVQSRTAGSPHVWAMLKFAANQAISILTSWWFA